MNFTGLLPRLKNRASSDADSSQKKRVNTNKRTLHFDLFAQLSYMAAVATAGVSRSQLFERASKLPYVSSKYFKSIHVVSRKLNVDYAEACRLEADRSREPEVKSLLLRMAGSLSSGEDEAAFLRREAEVIGETYSNKYAGEVESLKKWTDSYVALVVSAALIVIVAVISMMIYQVGVGFVIGLALAMVAISCAGAWIIYASAPREIVTRVVGPSSRLQRLATNLFKTLVPLAIAVGSAMLLGGVDLGWVILVGGGLVFFPGIVIRVDEKLITHKDDDIPTVVRVLGRVTSATGSTVADSLGKVDRRSMGDLAPEVTRLHHRLRAGIDPNLCWSTLVDETGSELVERTVQMFWDSISVGGEPGEVGGASAFFSSKIVYLRATRQLVATTFQYLVVPLHIALVGLLTFVEAIMAAFSSGIALSAGSLELDSGTTIGNSSLVITDLFTFGQVNMELVNLLVTAVLLVITLADSFAPYPESTEGGRRVSVLKRQEGAPVNLG